MVSRGAVHCERVFHSFFVTSFSFINLYRCCLIWLTKADLLFKIRTPQVATAKSIALRDCCCCSSDIINCFHIYHTQNENSRSSTIRSFISLYLRISFFGDNRAFFNFSTLRCIYLSPQTSQIKAIQQNDKNCIYF